MYNFNSYLRYICIITFIYELKDSIKYQQVIGLSGPKLDLPSMIMEVKGVDFKSLTILMEGG